MEAKELVTLAVAAMQDKKAEEIRLIDISEVSVVADYFLIAGGSNRSQIQAICDNVEEKLGRAGHPARQIEGYDTANWILMDFGDLIVHIFDKENRLLYDLERLWRDGKELDAADLS
ncbi:MAG: ribosome silencing factor [Lachnospiraceae bacterium]|nr:ribosome silencing factor [Lachnospiraceae bacterium]